MGMSYQDLLRMSLTKADDAAIAAARAQDQPQGDTPGILNAPVIGGALQGGANALGAVTGAPGIHQLLELMGYPGTTLAGILASGQATGQAGNPLESAGQGLGKLASRTGQYGPLGALGAAHGDWEDVPLSPQNFVAGMALDPFSYVGLGIPGKLGKLVPKGSALSEGLSKADAVEKAGQARVSTAVTGAFDKGVDLAREGLQPLSRLHPGFKTLLDESPEARVAKHAHDTVRMMGGMATHLGDEVGGRVLADLYRDPASPQYQAAYDRVAKNFQGMGLDLGPDTVHTALTQIPGMDPGFAEQLGGRIAPLYDRYDKDVAAARDIVDRMYPAGTRPESLDEAVRFAKTQGDPADHAILEQLADKWHGTDLLKANEDQAVASRYMRQVAAEEGLEHTPSKLGDAWKTALLAWRQQALTWPSYFMGNLGDAATFNLAKMGKPGLGDLGHNLAGVAGRLAEDSPHFDEFFRRWDKPYQHAKEAAHTMGPVWQDFAERVGLGDQLPPELVQAGLENSLGGIKGIGGRDPQALEKVPYLGRLVRLSREANEATELSARSAAYIHGYEQLLKDHAVDTADALGRIADQVSPKAGAAMRAHVESVDGVVNPRRVAEWMQAQGAPDELVGEAMREAGNLGTDAYHAGVDFSHKSHIDYSSRTNLDKHLANVTGFHFWATRNVPRYTELMATHPGLFKALATLDEDSDQYREENQISSPRLQGTVPLGEVGRHLADTFFGKPGQLFADPRRAMSIAQVPGSDVVRPARGEGGVGQVLDHLSAVGLSPNPFIQAGLDVAGVYGARQPGNMLRATPFVNAAAQAATGNQVDIEGPLKNVRRARPLGGESPAAPEDMIRWRLREMAAADTGNPNDQNYNNVPVGSQLWRRAVKDLGDRNLREGFLAMGGVPLRLYTDAEHALDMRRRT